MPGRFAGRGFVGAASARQHARSDSNTQPADLESAALPIELLA
jgi:hypothetical protein